MRIAGVALLALAGILHAQGSIPSCLLAMLNSQRALLPNVEIVEVVFVHRGKEFRIPQKFAKRARELSQDPHVPVHDLENLLAAMGTMTGMNTASVRHSDWAGKYNDAFSAPRSVSKAQELAIVTHQKTVWQEDTAAILKEADLKGIPLITLASAFYPVASNTLLDRSAQMQWSERGEVRLPPNARRFHLFGGYCFSCLASTMHAVVSAQSKVSNTQAEPIDIFVYSSQAYQSIYPQDSALGMLESSRLERLRSEYSLDKVASGLPGRTTISAASVVETPHGTAQRIQILSDQAAAPAVNVYFLAR